MKKLISFILVLVMLLGISPVFAATSEQIKAADTLYTLGLFKGSGTDASGKPIYDLDRSPTRAEALVMLIRLMGVEEETLGDDWTHPFTDVPDWVAPYVGFAYRQGLTKGISADTFGSDMPVQANMYLTFLLRALGYYDWGIYADFSYDNADGFAKSIGLTDEDYNGQFLRGDVAVLSEAALGLKLNGKRDGQDTTLIQYLVDNYVLDENMAANAGFVVHAPNRGDPAIVPVLRWELNYYSCFLSAADIKLAFPKAVALLSYGASDTEVVYSNTYSYGEMHFIWSLYASQMGANTFCYRELDENEEINFNGLYGYYYVVDGEFNILGVYYVGMQFVGSGNAMFIRGDEGVDGAKLYNEINSRLDTVMANYDSAELTVADVRFNPLDDYSGMTYTYPVYINGKQTDADIYFAAMYFLGSAESQQTFDPYSQIRNLMFSVLFLSDGTLEIVCQGYENVHFSDYGWRQQYSSTNDGPEDHYGVWLHELRDHTLLVAFDRDGIVKGYTIVPPTQ